MDHRELKRLVKLMNDNGLVELEIEREGLRVSLKKACSRVADGPVAPWPGMVPAGLMPAGLMPAGGPVPAPAETPASDSGPAAEPPGTRLILSPMVGTFYRRPSPDSDQYVDVGQTVDSETVVCIVEAMKVNNEIKAEISGQVTDILVEDGEPVEFDQPLFRVKIN